MLYSKLHKPSDIQENFNVLSSLGFIKEENLEELANIFKNSMQYKKLGTKINGIIFSGGSAEVRKRTALALMKETDFCFFEIPGSYFKTSKDITICLNRIQMNTPCILFINGIEKGQPLSPFLDLFHLIGHLNKDPEKIIVW